MDNEPTFSLVLQGLQADLYATYQLRRVCALRRVKEVVVVEKSEALTQLVMPRLQDRLQGKVVDVVIGDAHKVMKDMHADVALVDIFPSYGSNQLYGRYPKIKQIWCWGSAAMGGYL